VSKYQQLQSQNKISNEEATSLTQERNEQRRLRNSLVGKLSEAIAGGQGVFQGVTRDASDLGTSPLPQCGCMVRRGCVPSLATSQRG
jgi:hypothetical protein